MSKHDRAPLLSWHHHQRDLSKTTKMTPPETPKKPVRIEYDTIRRARFFNAYDDPQRRVSLRAICRRKDIDISASTGTKWLQKRAELGSPAIRKTRRLSTRLGRPNIVNDATVKAILQPSHPLNSEPYETIIEAENLSIQPRSLQASIKRRFNAKRFKKRRTTAISSKNRRERVQYGKEHKKKRIRSFWRYCYFTDEVHFNSKDLANRLEYELRTPGDHKPSIQEINQKEHLDVTVHLAAGISYDYKGAFVFYNDPAEPDISKPRKPSKPRRSKYESDEQYQKRLRDHEAMLTHLIDPKKDIPPKGNSMTQKFYTENVLPHHIQHIKKLEAKYNHVIYFQETVMDPTEHDHITTSLRH